eukprot:gene4108-4354_t
MIPSAELRLKVLALRAFNLETLLIAEQVKSREQLLMQIRYQWWRDALTSLSENVAPAKHPVLTALWHVNTSSKISKYQLKRLLDTREADALHHQTPLTIQELESVVSREADHAASHLGKAIGISLLLRGTPYQASKRRSYLPVELCVQHAVSQEDVYRGVVSEGMRDVTLAVASVAMGHLQEARGLAGKLPPAAPQVLLQAVLAGQYLKALEKAGFNPFDPHLSKLADTDAKAEDVLLPKSPPALQPGHCSWATLLVMTACISIICSIDRTCMSVAILPMSAQYNWPDSTKGAVNGAFSIGYTVTNLLGGFLAALYGPKRVLKWGVLVWSVFTLLTPAAASTELWVLLLVRAAMGFGEGVTFPCVQVLVKTSIPSDRRARSLSLIYSGHQLGSIIALLTSPAIILQLGWPWVFYLFSCLGFIWLAAGYASNHGDIATRYAGLLYGITNAGSSFAGSVAVYAVGVVLDWTRDWGVVFGAVAWCNVLSFIVYLSFATSTQLFE